jgi:hypothetical protein
MKSQNRITGLLRIGIVILLIAACVQVVSASTRVVPAGGVVVIGEQDLNVTRCVFGDTIGWWASPADVNVTSPSRMLTVTNNRSYNVAPSDFIDSSGFRYTGTWYNVNPANGRSYGIAFRVVNASTRVVPAGGVVTIGEIDLDVTRCVLGDTIGWWASPADVNVTSPSRMLTVTNNRSYNVATSEYIDNTGFKYTGTWYNINPANGRSYGAAFQVVSGEPTRIVPAGGVVVIGETNLDVTRCVFGDTIGWWASPADVNVTSPSRMLTVTSNKSYNVAPSDFIDSTGFKYTGTWYNVNSATGRSYGVAFRVAASRSPPVAVDDSYSMKKNTVLSMPPDGVLKNDNNPAGLTLAAVKVTSPKHGTVVLKADGSFTYTPVKGYVGTDSFTYKASDGQSYSNNAAVKLTIRR